jgi:hypothetical protein
MPHGYLREDSLSGITSSALFALEWFLSGVRADVPVKMVGFGEGPTAYWTSPLLAGSARVPHGSIDCGKLRLSKAQECKVSSERDKKRDSDLGGTFPAAKTSGGGANIEVLNLR